MPPLPRASDVGLGPDAGRRLAALLDLEADRVRQACSEREFGAPVCALGLIYVASDDLPTATYTYAETVGADLLAAGCEDPGGAFVCDLAHRLSDGLVRRWR